MLELARLADVERFVYISSGAAYGLTRDPDQTYNEDDPPQPGNLYGITKFASECLARRYGQLHGFSAVSLRVSTPYGPMERVTGHRDNMSTPYQWTGQMLRGEPIAIDHSDHGRDLTYVVDTGSAVAAVVDAPALPHDLYNITNGVPVTGGQIQRQLAELFPKFNWSNQMLRNMPAQPLAQRAAHSPATACGTTWAGLPNTIWRLASPITYNGAGSRGFWIRGCGQLEIFTLTQPSPVQGEGDGFRHSLVNCGRQFITGVPFDHRRNHQWRYRPTALTTCPSSTGLSSNGPTTPGWRSGYPPTWSTTSTCPTTRASATPGLALPTLMSSNILTRDYGNRVGFWRMLEPLDKHGIRCCVSLNLAVLEHFPEIAEAMVERDYDFMSHGIYNTRYLYTHTEDQEREFYRDCIDT